MHEIQIQVVELQVREAFLEGGSDRVGVKVSDPQFASDEHILSLDSTIRIIENLGERFTDFFLIPINLSTVDVSVSGLEGFYQAGAHEIRFTLEGPEPNDRHFGARVQYRVQVSAMD